MVDPLAMTVATTIVTKIADTLTDRAQQAVGAVVRRIREKLRARPGVSDEVAAFDAEIATGDASAVEALAGTIGRLFEADPGFRDEIQGLWNVVRLDESVTNVFHGKADKVIMMRDVNGDLTIN
jgi:hypothetical protein